MKDINISTTLIELRKEKCITQDDIAKYIGVSKASVSKWETGKSYPDITLLPQLATYFNISIDQLLGYSPQMTKADIRKLYHKMSHKFTTDPIDTVIHECKAIIKKYYSCFNLLLQMCILLLNHSIVIKNVEERNQLLNYIVNICKRIHKESDAKWIVKQVESVEANCYFLLNEPHKVLALFSEESKTIIDHESLKATAYTMLGDVENAQRIMQCSIYQYMLYTVGILCQYMKYTSDDLSIYMARDRAYAIIDSFKLDKLHYSQALVYYIIIAECYILHDKNEDAIDAIAKYADIAQNTNLTNMLHGDEFFNKIDGWLSTLDLGVQPPIDEKTIQNSIIETLSNPVFEQLKSDSRYNSIIQKLKNHFERKL